MGEIYSAEWGFAIATIFIVLFVWASKSFINKLPPGRRGWPTIGDILNRNNAVKSPEFSDEILVNLPFKTLVQLSCTSRHLYNRIRSPILARAQLRKTLESNANTIMNTCLLASTHLRGSTTFFTTNAVDRAGSLSVTALPNQPFYDDSTRRAEIVGHSGGLVCVVAHRFRRGPELKKFRDSLRTWDSAEHNPRVAMWNPTLSWCHFVPTLPWFEIPTGNQELQRLPPVFGFGYNRYTETHEIIRLAQVFHSVRLTYTTQVHSYTLGTNASQSRWQRLPDLDEELYEIAAGFSDARAYSSPFVHNRMHWLMTTADKDPYKVRVLTFDIEHYFTSFAGPDGLDLMLYGPRLCGLGESLCLVEAMESGCVCVWEMDSYGDEDSWAVTYEVGGPGSELEGGFPLFEREGAVRSTYFVLNEPKKSKAVKGGTSFLWSFVLGGGDGVRRCPRRPCPWLMGWPRS